MSCLKYFHFQLQAPALLVLLFPDHLNNPPSSFDGISLKVFIALSCSPFNLLSSRLYKIKLPLLLSFACFVCLWQLLLSSLQLLGPLWALWPSRCHGTGIAQSLGGGLQKTLCSLEHLSAFPQVRALLGSLVWFQQLVHVVWHAQC